MGTVADASPPPAAEAGAVVAGYKLLRPLGRGASARVWLGQHEGSGGLAALKLLTADDAKQARDLLERERRALLRLRHPNIVPVFDIDDACIVTAYVEGADLRQRLRTPMEPADAVEIACVVGAALAAAHEAGVVHCDVKPANVLVDRHRTPFLVDFGISHLVGEVGDEGELVGGTPAYMAPEQAAGEVSPAADQYGLARTLLAMLLGGTPPRDRDSALDLLDHDAEERLAPILVRALADEPEERYPDVGEFVAALRAVELPSTARVRRRVAMVRSAEPFAWAAHPSRVEQVTEQISVASYRMTELVAAGVIDSEAWQRFRETTGHDDFGWSVYARGERLGPIDEPEALARVRECVVLAHGLFVTRGIWRDVAMGVARDNATAIALTPDVLGFGESTFGSGPAHACSPAGLARSLRDWLALIGLDETPTVMLGHSFSGGALLSVRDQDLGKTTRRIAVTPALFSASLRSMLWSLSQAVLVLSLSVLPAAITRRIARRQFRRERTLQNVLVSVRDQMAVAAERLGWRRVARLMWVAALSKPIAPEELHNCIVVTTPDDPLVPHEDLELTLQRVGIPASHHYALNYGGHFPQLVDDRRPEWGARNVHELVSVVDGVMELTTTSSASESPAEQDGADTTRRINPRA